MQKAVYWGNPRQDGFGHMTYDPPIEIDCHWEDREQLLSLNEGEKIISRAMVYVPQTLAVNGLLYLGTLDDLTSAQEVEPHNIGKICVIKRFETYGGIVKPFSRIYKAFLTPWLT